MSLMDLEARLNGLTQEVGQLTQRVHTLEVGKGAIQNQLNNVSKKLDAQGEPLAALKESPAQALQSYEK